jgi:uncharacterized protein YciI
MMQTFLCRLIPPRATFPFDMSDEEKAQMGAHVVYWQKMVDDGRCLAFGPVLQTGAPWGLGIVRAADETACRALIDADPTVKAALNTYELHPMPVAVTREPKAGVTP